MKLLNDFFHIITNTRTEGTYICSIELNATHVIYKAHFPGNPVTPGVCLLQIATECLEQDFGKRLYIREVKNLKFLSVLSPAENTHVDFVFSKMEETDTECKVQIAVVSKEKQYAKISIIYAHGSF